MEKVGGLCELCLKEGKYTPADAVHHIRPLNPGNINDPEITLNFDNLMAVCRECHARLHSRYYEAQAARRYRVDECGHVIIDE